MTKKKQIQSQLVQSTNALTAIASGFDQLAYLLALTLGPTQGTVINAKQGVRDPELLTDSGIIVKRVIGLQDRAEDNGAMLLRKMVLDLHERYGDGGATAAVLAQAMVEYACKLIAAGANPMRMRSGMEKAVAAAIQALQNQMQPAAGLERMKHLAIGATHDPELGAIIGEMYDVLGTHAALVVDEFYSPYLEREYLDGGRWTGRPANRNFLPEGQREVALENPLIMVALQDLERVADIYPILELATAQNDSTRRPLVIFARDFKSEALTTLSLNHARGVLNIGAVIPAANLMSMVDEMEDIATMVGASVLSETIGKTARQVQRSDLGSARRVLIARQAITIIGGGSDPLRVQKRITNLRAEMAKLKRSEKAWETHRLRIGRLAGGIGILKVGAYTEKARDLRREAAIKAQRMLEIAMESGVVPGGGVAYLPCIAAARSARSLCSDDDEKYGVEIVANALSAPFEQIVANHGKVHPPVALARVGNLPYGYGFNAESGDYVPMLDAGIIDCLAVSRGALEAAASVASLAITVDAIIFKKAQKPKPSRIDNPFRLRRRMGY